MPPPRAPGESPPGAIRRDYAERIAAGDVTLGPPTPAFARMVQSSHVLTSRGREIEDMREQALGDAIAAETGTDDPQQRIVAAQLASVHRVLFPEGVRRARRPVVEFDGREGNLLCQGGRRMPAQRKHRQCDGLQKKTALRSNFL